MLKYKIKATEVAKRRKQVNFLRQVEGFYSLPSIMPQRLNTKAYKILTARNTKCPTAPIQQKNHPLTSLDYDVL